MDAVLVTGTSSGIGNKTAHYLANKGLFVYATIRKQEDGKHLKHKNIKAILVDVTDTNVIEKISSTISSDHKLVGLVNNAGIGSLGFLHSFSEEEMFDIFNINTFGPWRMTNALLKDLMKNKGRIVNVSSQGGMITKALYGPYSMTKFALEAYTDALREELSPFGVYVSVIQPGGVATAIGNNSTPGIIERLNRLEPPFKEIGDQIKASFENPSSENQGYNPDLPESETNRNISSTEDVAEEIYHALTDKNPKHRYLIGSRWEGNRVVHALLQKLIDENNSSGLEYSLDDLIELLTEKYNNN